MNLGVTPFSKEDIYTEDGVLNSTIKLTMNNYQQL